MLRIFSAISSDICVYNCEQNFQSNLCSVLPESCVSHSKSATTSAAAAESTATTSTAFSSTSTSSSGCNGPSVDRFLFPPAEDLFPFICSTAFSLIALKIDCSLVPPVVQPVLNSVTLSTLPSFSTHCDQYLVGGRKRADGDGSALSFNERLAIAECFTEILLSDESNDACAGKSRVRHVSTCSLPTASVTAALEGSLGVTEKERHARLQIITHYLTEFFRSVEHYVDLSLSGLSLPLTTESEQIMVLNKFRVLWLILNLFDSSIHAWIVGWILCISLFLVLALFSYEAALLSLTLRSPNFYIL